MRARASIAQPSRTAASTSATATSSAHRAAGGASATESWSRSRESSLSIENQGAGAGRRRADGRALGHVQPSPRAARGREVGLEAPLVHRAARDLAQPLASAGGGGVHPRAVVAIGSS